MANSIRAGRGPDDAEFGSAEWRRDNPQTTDDLYNWIAISDDDLRELYALARIRQKHHERNLLNVNRECDALYAEMTRRGVHDRDAT